MIFMVIHTLVSYFLVAIAYLIFMVPLFIFLIVPERWRYNSIFMFYWVNIFYRVILKCTLLPIKYKGLENLPADSAIFIANHQSSLDIPLLGVLAGAVPHVWLAKHELLDSVFLRFILPRVSIMVDTSTRQTSMRSLLAALRLVGNGQRRHLMIFPEGGRYTDGKVHEFFGGFGLLAKKTGKPLVPVFIKGVAQIYPPGSFWIKSHPIMVTVGKPFYYHEQETDEEFKNRVRAWFVAHEN